MSSLVINNVDEALVRRLKMEATMHGVTAEEEHLQILSKALQVPIGRKESKPKRSLVEFLLHSGEEWPEDFVPARSKSSNINRQVSFE